MSDLSVVNPNTLAGAVVTMAAAAGGGDRFQAGFGQKYELRLTNGSGGAITVTVDDPDATNPGSYKTLNRDVDIVVAAGTTKVVTIDGTRFRDANGWVNLSYSGVTSLTVGVTGPFA